MSGLVAYGSSDEDSEGPETKPAAQGNIKQDVSKLPPMDSSSAARDQEAMALAHTTDPIAESQDTDRTEADNRESKDSRAIIDKTNNSTASYAAENESIKSTSGTTLRSLTLPSVPNLDIPPSPPGPPSEAMTAKVVKFLELKQQGIHFNEKLATSSSLKNPSLFAKLSTFAGLDYADQYATTLPLDLWNPGGFPSRAYKDQLAKAQEDANRSRREDIKKGLRSGVEFVRSKQT